MNDLTGLTSTFVGYLGYVAIHIETIKIKSNLVFDKHIGELTTSVDLGKPLNGRFMVSTLHVNFLDEA